MEQMQRFPPPLLNSIDSYLAYREYPRPDFNGMIQTTRDLLLKYDITFDNRCRIFEDGANPSFIRVAYFKKQYPYVYDLQFIQQNMFVIPVPFSKEHKNMLAHAYVATTR
jgi:hypothetical protein